MKFLLILFLAVYSVSINADEKTINPEEIAQNTIELLKSAKSGVDLQLLQKAQTDLTPWLDCQSVPNSILLARGLLRYKQQHIIQANQDISLYLERNPNDLTALTIQGAIYRQSGEYDKAREICRQASRKISKVSTAICLADILWRQQGLFKARNLIYEQLQNVVIEAQQESPQAYQRLHLELVKIEQLIEQFVDDNRFIGSSQSVPENMIKALSAPYRDNVLWIAYSDFLLKQGNYEQLLNEIPNDSNDIRIQIRRAIAAKKLGKTENVNVDVFTQAKTQNNLSLRTDEALYLLEIAENPQAALDLLLEVWETRKEPFEAKLLMQAAKVLNLKASDPNYEKISSIVIWIRNWMMGKDTPQWLLGDIDVQKIEEKLLSNTEKKEQ
jgi:tetratricopeptide (TPR) repeat protein